jgi:hypothetical protein
MDIMFDTEFFGCYFVQVKDAAGNQVFSIADYRTAIDATEVSSDITDLIVLSYFDALSYSKSSIEQMNDPFAAKERLLWVGAPIGTELGDSLTPGTFIYLAVNTLQFGPDSPGRGNVILLGNPGATRTVTLEDNTTTTVTLDGSFVAAYAAARTAAFTDPSGTLLNKDCSSFDTVEVWNEKEEVLLGGASITTLSYIDSGVYRFIESKTVTTSEPGLQEISARTQAHYVVKRVRNELKVATIGFVPPSTAAGEVLITSSLVQSLSAMASNNIIAPYGQEEDPKTIRQINPASDIKVWVDENDPRIYHFQFFFNIRYPIKNLFGLYSLDTKFFDNRNLASSL